MNSDLLNSVPGGAELVAWFGYAPRFHDAEILSVVLDREEPSCSLRVHGFEMTGEVDADGFFVFRKHVVVTFLFRDLTEVNLEGFNQQNAVMGLYIGRGLDAQYRMEIEPAFGLAGVIEGRGLEINLSPGVPQGSQYERLGGAHGQVRARPSSP